MAKTKFRQVQYSELVREAREGEKTELGFDYQFSNGRTLKTDRSLCQKAIEAATEPDSE